MSIYSPENIEETLSGYNEPNSMGKFLFNSHILIKSLKDHYFTDLNDNDLTFVLKTLIKYKYINENDISVLIKQIRDENFIEYLRITPWHFSTIQSLDYTGKNISYGCCKANFHLINKWGFSSSSHRHLIIYDKETLEVAFADLGNLTDFDIDNNIENSEMYITHKNMMYKIDYVAPTIWLFLNPCSENKKLADLECDNLDRYINMVCKDTIYSGHGFIMDLEFAKNADINSIVGNNFFKTGSEWKYGNHTMYNGITPTGIKSINTKNNTFVIEIENNTHISPLIQTIFLDIEEFLLSNEKNNKKEKLVDFDPRDIF